MELSYDGTLVMPNNFVDVNNDEMEYIEGGLSVQDTILTLLLGVVSGIIGNKLSPYCTLAVAKSALAWAGSAANAIWAGISSAAAFVWNTPVALAIVIGVVAVTVGVIAGYCLYKYGVKK